MRKTDSTNHRNERRLVVECPMTYTFTLLGKRWKPIILWKIHEGYSSPAELRRAIPLISRKMLFQDLLDLTHDGMVLREDGPQPRHSLSTKAEELLPVLQGMQAWGGKHRTAASQGASGAT